MSDAGGRRRNESNRSLPERLLNRAVGAVVSPIVDNVDVDDVIERLDVNELLERVDVNAVLDRIEPDRLLDRIDIDRLLERVDANALLDRVDPERLLERLDMNALLERVDVNEIVRRTELDVLIARSTTGVFTQLIDVARTRLVSVDQAVQAVPARVLHRAHGNVPATPVDPNDKPDLVDLSPRRRAVVLQGHFAGSVSRFLAFLVDQFLIGTLFAVGAVLLASATQVVIGRELDITDGRWQVATAYALWSIVYVWVQLAASGRTIGKALLGLLVVGRDGSALRNRQALIRPLAFPLSFVFFGVGFLLGLFRADRRQLHDLVAGTAVIYAWDTSTAELRANGVEGDPRECR